MSRAGARPISRLLLVGSEFPPIGGGVSRVGESLALGFSRLGITVGLVGPEASEHYARLHDYPFWGFRGRFLDMPVVLTRAARSFKPDLCLFTTWWPAAFWHSWLLPRVPFAVIYHGAELLNSSTTLRKRFRAIVTSRAIKPVLSKGRCHITVSDYARKLLVRDYPSKLGAKVKTIPNGVSSDWPALRPPDTPPSRPYILFVGRLEATKGVHNLLNAFDMFAGANKSHELVLVGDGPLRTEILHRSKSLRLWGRVRLMGNLRLPELGWVYKNCEFLILPSEADFLLPKVEGFGLVILEASLWNKPAIGTKSGGIPSAIVDGVTGMLVPERSSVELSAAMDRLANDEELRNRLGTNAGQHALRDHDWTHVSRRYLLALGSCI